MYLRSQHTCLKQIVSRLNTTQWYIICHLSELVLLDNSFLSKLDESVSFLRKKIAPNIEFYYLRYEHSFLLAFTQKKTRNYQKWLKNKNTELSNQITLTEIVKIRKLLQFYLQNTIQNQRANLRIYSTKRDSKIPFLGYFICHKSSQITKTKNQIELLIDIRQVIRSLSTMGYCDRFGKPKPNFRYYSQSQYNIIANASSTLRGIACYYELAKLKYTFMSQLCYIVTHSLAMTFAAKFKLRTRAKVFRLAGSNLQKPLF